MLQRIWAQGILTQVTFSSPLQWHGLHPSIDLLRHSTSCVRKVYKASVLARQRIFQQVFDCGWTCGMWWAQNRNTEDFWWCFQSHNKIFMFWKRLLFISFGFTNSVICDSASLLILWYRYDTIKVFLKTDRFKYCFFIARFKVQFHSCRNWLHFLIWNEKRKVYLFSQLIKFVKLSTTFLKCIEVNFTCIISSYDYLICTWMCEYRMCARRHVVCNKVVTWTVIGLV